MAGSRPPRPSRPKLPKIGYGPDGGESPDSAAEPGQVTPKPASSRSSLWKLLTMKITFGPDLEAPMVRMIYPTEYEVFRPGTVVRVRWESEDNVAVKWHRVAFSQDDGVTYTDASPALPGEDQSYPWQVPDAPTTKGRIKVVAGDSAGNTAYASSKNPFAIEREPDPPTVTLLAPLGKQVLRAGSAVVISWRSQKGTPPLRIDIALSFDGGASYHPLARGMPAAARMFRWQVPGVATKSARLRITVHDSAGRTAEDKSDADLAIAAQK